MQAPHAVLDPLRERLLAHPLQRSLRDEAAVRRFMEAHVFAVWDFMSLLKRLQRELTCVEVPWRPPAHPAHARLVNEIVLAEESDDDGRGGHLSHFALYRAAMEEVGADASRLDAFLRALGEGQAPTEALESTGAPPHVAAFVRVTLDVAVRGSVEEVAAAFFHGREAILPEVFAALLEHFDAQGRPADRLRHYLARHVEIDGGSHGPLAEQLLRDLCAGSTEREARAVRAAARSLEARLALWDGVAASLAP